MPDFVMATKELKDDLENLFKTKRIYFGHQSVGANVVDGAQSLLDRSGIDLQLGKIEKNTSSDSGFFHSHVGKNFDPLSKLNAFKGIATERAGKNYDYVGVKLCYVDITRNTDLQGLFDAYKATIEYVRQANSKITIFHFTVPLMIAPEDNFRTFVKRVLGRYDNNVARNKYNDMLRSEYKESSLLFDIAKLESTLLNGDKVWFEVNGTRYQSLASEYTTDGGHLNDQGRDYIGYEFLKFLAGL